MIDHFRDRRRDGCSHREWQPAALVRVHCFVTSMWRWPQAGWRMPRHGAAGGILKSQSFTTDGSWDPGRNTRCMILCYRIANLSLCDTFPCNAPFPESSSPACQEGTEPAGVNCDFVETSRKPALCPLPGPRRAIIHAGDPMLGDMALERGNVWYW